MTLEMTTKTIIGRPAKMPQKKAIQMTSKITLEMTTKVIIGVATRVPPKRVLR